MDEIRISVAMCTYNGARFLLEQLESIADQTTLPDELVICDDQSTDESIEIIRAFASRASFAVRIEVNKENLGSTKNFEKAVNLCRGEIIVLADQDDVWQPQKLAVIYRTLEAHPSAGYVFSDGELINEYGVLNGRKLWEAGCLRGSFLHDFAAGRQVEVLLRWAVVTGATMAFRSNLKTIITPFCCHFVHDYWISLLASCLGAYGAPISEPLIRYRLHMGQQIGVGKKSLLDKVKRGRIAAIDRKRNVLGLQDVRDRLLLAAADGRTPFASHMHLIEEKLAHCSVRAAAHSVRGLARVRKVFSEVRTGRYGRFSNSWQSIVEDLYF